MRWPEMSLNSPMPLLNNNEIFISKLEVMPVNFIFLALPQPCILDLGGADQARNEAIDCNADFEIEYFGLEEPVITTSGLPLGDIQHYSKIKLRKGDFLIVPGSSFTYRLNDILGLIFFNQMVDIFVYAF
jgi:hypothetical protein